MIRSYVWTHEIFKAAQTWTSKGHEERSDFILIMFRIGASVESIAFCLDFHFWAIVASKNHRQSRRVRQFQAQFFHQAAVCCPATGDIW